MKKLAIAALAILGFASQATAGLANCQNVYVGRIWLENGNLDEGGLKGVVFLESPTDGGGSFWVYFNELGVGERKAMLALLLAAKVAGHRVDVKTTNSDQCGIATGGSEALAIYMSNQF